MIEVCTVGGFSEVGKNMVAVKYKDEVVLFDMGLEMDKYIRLKGNDDVERLSMRQLTQAGAVPDLSLIKDWKKKVIAIVPSHGHLDHIGAIPYLANTLDAPIVCTKYTAEVLRRICQDNELPIKNQIHTLENNGRIRLTKNINLEFINMTHSIPDTVMIAMHTPEGTAVYANDFKFDNYPIIGKKPNYEKLRELGDGGNVKLLIADSLYSWEPKKTPSESVARDMLKDVLLGVSGKDQAIIITTFSSHIARLKTIFEFGKTLNRQVVFLGRSLGRYIYAAEDLGIVNFSESAVISSYKSQVKKQLARIDKMGREKFLIVTTGHQGEPDAVLSKIANDELNFRIGPHDHVIFSCNVIPSPQNVDNRTVLEEKLRSKRARIFRDIHVSGHASREDHRDLINMLRPKHIIPSHGDISKTSGTADLAEQMGYDVAKTVHLMTDGQRIEID